MHRRRRALRKPQRIAHQSALSNFLLNWLEPDTPKQLDLDQFLKLDDPPISLGKTGDRVRELQATLNKRLIEYQQRQPDHYIRFKKSVGIGTLQPQREFERDPKQRVRVVFDPKSQFKAFQIRGDWRPTDKDGKLIEPIPDPESDDPDAYAEAWGIRLPELPEVPLKVDGVYGQRTYAAVMLFQKIQNLPTSGEVDAVTLDKLEPMVPTNRMLSAIMNWVTGDFEYKSPPDNYAWVVKTKPRLI